MSGCNTSARSNVTLIGMPGAGKSTLGVLLAKALLKDFVDTDVLIQRQEGCSLRDYQEKHGAEAFLVTESTLLENLQLRNTVIATGGSAVYSDPAINALKAHSRMVFIDVPLDELRHRIHNADNRGIVQQPGQDFSSLYQERWPLYKAASDIHIEAASHAQDAVLALMIDALNH